MKNPVSEDDGVLIERCRQGQRDAFGCLVRRYQNRLFNTVCRLVGSDDQARDIVQDAFVAAYQALDRFHGNANFYTWLYRIAINASISAHRRRLRRPDPLSIDSQLDPVGEEPGAPVEATRPSRHMETAETRQAIADALAALTPEYRAVVVLRDLEEHDYQTIAEILDCPVGTVRSRLHRARMLLREKLKDLVVS